MTTDYVVLAERLQASPLYKRIKNQPKMRQLLMNLVYETWVVRTEEQTYDCQQCGKTHNDESGICGDCWKKAADTYQKEKDDGLCWF